MHRKRNKFELQPCSPQGFYEQNSPLHQGGSLAGTKLKRANTCFLASRSYFTGEVGGIKTWCGLPWPSSKASGNGTLPLFGVRNTHSLSSSLSIARGAVRILDFCRLFFATHHHSLACVCLQILRPCYKVAAAPCRLTDFEVMFFHNEFRQWF